MSKKTKIENTINDSKSIIDVKATSSEMLQTKIKLPQATTLGSDIIYRELKPTKTLGRILGNKSFNMCIKQQTAPGFYTQVHGTSEINFEALSRLLATEDRHVKLGHLLMDYDVTVNLITKLIPAKKIKEGTFMLRPRAVMAEVSKALGSDIRVTQAYQTILRQVLAPLKIMSDDAGIMSVEYRQSEHPTLEDLRSEVMGSRIAQKLAGQKLRVDISAREYTVTILADEVMNVLYEIGTALVSLSDCANDLKALLYFARKKFLENWLGKEDKLEEYLEDNSALSECCTNVTLMRLAFDISSDYVVRIPQHMVELKLAGVMRDLKSSPRWKFETLLATTAHIGHFQLKGLHERVYGVIPYGDVALIPNAQIGVFSPRKSSVVETYSFTRRKMYEDHLTTITTAAMPSNHVMDAARMAQSLLSARGFKEGDKHLGLCINLSEANLFTYALVKAKTVTMVLQEGVYKMMFKVDANDVNIKIEDPELFNMHYVEDPLTYLMSIPSAEPARQMVLKDQSVLDTHLSKEMLQGPNHFIDGLGIWARRFDKELTFDVEIAGEQVSLATSTSDLLGLSEYDVIHSIIQPVAARLFAIPLQVLELISNDIFKLNSKNSELTADERTFFKQQYANRVGQIFERVMLSTEGSNLGATLHQHIRSSNPSAEFREKVRLYSREEAYQAQIRFIATSEMLLASGILTYADYKIAKTLLTEGKWFAMQLGNPKYQMGN